MANTDLPVQRASGGDSGSAMKDTNASSFPMQSPARPKQEESKDQGGGTLF